MENKLFIKLAFIIITKSVFAQPAKLEDFCNSIKSAKIILKENPKIIKKDTLIKVPMEFKYQYIHYKQYVYIYPYAGLKIYTRWDTKFSKKNNTVLKIEYYRSSKSRKVLFDFETKDFNQLIDKTFEKINESTYVDKSHKLIYFFNDKQLTRLILYCYDEPADIRWP